MQLGRAIQLVYNGLMVFGCFLMRKKGRYCHPPLEQSIMVVCSLKGKNTRLDY